VAYALVPTLLAVITSLNSVWNHFASDDLEQVLNNALIKHLGNIGAAFTKSVWSFAGADIVFTVDPYFRPLFSALFTINYALFGSSPAGWHLVNVSIHATVTFLVFVVARKVIGRVPVAALTASLFAVHPVHAESVAWISGVTDPLMAAFALPAFYFYLKFHEGRQRRALGGALAFYFLSLLTKETAIALLLVVAYCEVFHFKEQKPLKSRLMELTRIGGLFVATTIVYFLMRFNAVGSLALGGRPRHPLLPALLTIPLAIVKYLGLMFIPFGYSYQHYTELVPGALSVSFLVPVVLLITIGACAVALKSGLLNFAAVWFLLTLVPALASIRNFEPGYLIQERYLYLPSVGICMAVALGIEWIGMRNWLGTRQRIAAAVLTVVLLLAWSLILVRQNRVWDNSLTVYKNSVAVAPLSPVAHVQLSRAYYDTGRPREAEAEARTAMELDTRCAGAYLNLSYFAKQSGKLDKACEYLENAVATIPENTMTQHDLATIYLNLGMVYGQRKMLDQAEQNLLRSIEVSPRAVAWYYTGQFYLEQRRLNDALTMFQKTLEEVPAWFAPVHLKLGLVYETLGDTQRAESEYDEFLRLAPDAPEHDDVKTHLNEMRQPPSPRQDGKRSPK
jgi:tetratricopeptide (TPR) repeat protein